MKILILAGKSIDDKVIASLVEGHDYTVVRLASVSRGVRRLDETRADCTLLVPDEGDPTWQRAVTRIKNEYTLYSIVLFQGTPPGQEIFDSGIFDYFMLEGVTPDCLHKCFRHLQRIVKVERKLAKEQALREWMEKTDSFGSWEMDREGVFHWSKGLLRVLDGRISKTSDLNDVRRLVHPEDLEMFDRANDATFKEGWPLGFEYRVTGADEMLKHLHVNRHVELDAGGDVVQAYGMVRDVSLYKEFEELISRRDEILQVLATFSGRFLRGEDWRDGIGKAMDDLGQAVNVTRVYLFRKSNAEGDEEELHLEHEWTAEGVDPVGARMEFLSKDYAARYSAWRTAMLRRKVVSGHARDFGSDEGQAFAFSDAKSILIVPVFAGSTWWGVLGLSEHRAERDWLPVEIESLTLAATIFGSAINYGIMGEELMAANRSAEEASSAALEANMAKSMFLANMSHEIRTPISGILGMSEMLVTTGLNSGQREHVDMIRDAADSLLGIVNDILDISKVEAGKMELKPVDFDFRSEVETSIRAFVPLAAANGLVFTFRVTDDVPASLNGDPDRLGQVLRNLVGNSLKFTEEGSVSLNVSVTKRYGDRVCLFFQVEDTGVGIATDKLDSIFDIFIQADSSLRKKHQGTGLGLAICRQLVNMMGGEIGVESEEGRGSTFHFSAWFGVAEDASVEVAEAGNGLPETLHLNILLAEDNPMNQKYLTHFLSMFGHTITTANNGIEALNALESGGRKIDIVLMDIQMPEMSGIEATRAIRESDGRLYDRNIPIVALTAYAMKGDRERMLEAGMDEYVSKPVDMQELSGTIARLMSNRGSGTAPRKRPIRPRPAREEKPVESIKVSIDMNALKDRFEGNMVLLKDILDLFVMESGAKLMNLENGMKARDPKAVGAALHSITNISSHVLAMDVVQESRKLEKRCYTEKLEAVIKDIENLKPRFKALVAVVADEARKL